MVSFWQLSRFFLGGGGEVFMDAVGSPERTGMFSLAWVANAQRTV